LTRQEPADVIIVGGESAVSARQTGAERVVMLEKAPEEEFGGNARYSHTGFRYAYNGTDDMKKIVSDLDPEMAARFDIPAYWPDRFTADLNRVTQGRIDQELARFMVDQSNSALRWMFECGIKFEPEQRREANGKFYFEPGIMVDTPDDDYDITAPLVIVCAGGFQANPEMRARYLGPNADLMRVRGSKHNTGEVLRMLLDLGVKAAGHWQDAHFTPIDRNEPDGGTPLPDDGHSNTCNRYDYPMGITVNALGERFYDEGESNHSYTYAKTGRAVLAQPGGTAHQIFDQKGINLFRLGAEYTDTYEEAETIAALAGEIGLDAEPLIATIDEFDAACSDVPSDPSPLDGKSTSGLKVNKSNWANPVDEGPFRAYPITCGVTFSFGGVRINTRAEVLDVTDKPIMGLYASGDVVGLFFYNYPSCAGQTRNAVFSGEAGHSAAAPSN
jgi:tricarballylate dehydrogenase